jgi:hypothetical protein
MTRRAIGTSSEQEQQREHLEAFLRSQGFDPEQLPDFLIK